MALRASDSRARSLRRRFGEPCVRVGPKFFTEVGETVHRFFDEHAGLRRTPFVRNRHVAQFDVGVAFQARNLDLKEQLPY